MNINRMNQPLHGHLVITSLILVSLCLVFGMGIYFKNDFSPLPPIAYWFMMTWLLAAIGFCLLSYRDFVTGFLLTLFCTLIGWRIAGLYDIYLISVPLLLTFLLILADFFYCAARNIKYPESYANKISVSGWQLIFIRLYIGLNFVPHFTEKLFAGPLPHLGDVQAFVALGIPHADLFVWLAGLCEFVAAFSIGLGVLLRLGSCFAVVYLLIATYLGHHFFLGFIWANPGGGWEFATMWTVLIFSFLVTGFHEFSLDQTLENKLSLPSWIRKCL